MFFIFIFPLFFMFHMIDDVRVGHVWLSWGMLGVLLSPPSYTNEVCEITIWKLYKYKSGHSASGHENISRKYKTH